MSSEVPLHHNFGLLTYYGRDLIRSINFEITSLFLAPYIYAQDVSDGLWERILQVTEAKKFL
jgi:hypothetical protein